MTLSIVKSAPSPGSAELVDLASGRTYSVSERLVIGRDPSCDVRIDDLMVGRRHAEIRCNDDGVCVVADLATRHGTIVAGKRIAGATTLADGDEILIANVRLKFTAAAPATASQPVAVELFGDPMSSIKARISVTQATRIVRARDLEATALARDHERLRALVEVARSLGTEHDPVALVERLLRVVLDLLPGARRTAILLLDQTGATATHVSRDRDGNRDPFTPPTTVMQEVLAQRAGVLTIDAEVDDRFSRSASIVAAGIRSALCAPIVAPPRPETRASSGTGGVFGVIYVDSQDLAGAFTHVDLEMVTSIAGQAALALENALLVQRVRDHEAAERQRIERSAHEERLALLGRVTGGIAHDFNNLLHVILSYTELAQETAGADSRVTEDLAMVRDAASRAAGLTRQLLAFGRRELIRPQVIELNTHVGGVERLLRRTLGAQIQVRTRLGGGMPKIKMDPTQLEQVIANLVINARDALGEGGGVLAIETAAVDIDADEARRLPGVSAGRHAELVVADTGTGMTPEVLARIFEPFFTTKPKDHGTGLGLATVHGIVHQSGGTITVSSLLGHGSRFRVLFPSTTDETAAEVAPPPPQNAQGETVLVAEDQPAVRRMIERVLKSRGYHVLSAANGADALDLARRHTGAIDLLVTDAVMPGMTGPALATAIHELRPATQIMFVSGHVQEDLGVDQIGDRTLLCKPFTSAELLDQVRRAITEKKPEPDRDDRSRSSGRRAKSMRLTTPRR